MSSRHARLSLGCSYVLQDKPEPFERLNIMHLCVRPFSLAFTFLQDDCHRHRTFPQTTMKDAFLKNLQNTTKKGAIFESHFFRSSEKGTRGLLGDTPCQMELISCLQVISRSTGKQRPAFQQTSHRERAAVCRGISDAVASGLFCFCY
jgi:hypothetical protein